MNLRKFSVNTLCLAAALSMGMAGCKSNNPDTADAAQDPADINNAAPTDQTQATDQTAAAPQEAAPAPSEPRHHRASSGTEEQAPEQAPAEESYQAAPTDTGYGTGYDQGYEAGIQAQQPPPPLPEYQQPECPQPNYIWTPGYWHYAPVGGYYWVPGVWVAPPYVGGLWTPGYWGFAGGFYRLHQGYWGAHIGYYGGIPYGYGYNGAGFYGGYWNHDRFTYNTAVTRVNTTIITNTYTHNVTNIYNNNTYTHISYNGGQGGLQVRPTPAQIAVMREPHVNPLPQQIEHRQQAQQNRAQYVTANGGHPAVLVAAKPIELAHVAPAPGLVNPGFRGETVRSLAARPTPAARPAETMRGPEPNGGSMRGPEPANHPAEGRPAEARPAEPARPEPGRPAPEARPAAPAARPEAHPAPQPHAMARPAEHPAPQAHPQPQQHPAEHPAARPAEHPAAKPKPEARPEEKKKPEEPR